MSGNEDGPGPSNVPANLIQQFKDICAVDDAVARNYLEENAWNLEAAVQLFLLSNDPSVIENQDNHEQEIRRRRNANSQSVNEPQRDVVQHRPSVAATWSQWFRGLLLLPFRFFWWSFRDVIQFIFSFLGIPPLTLTDPQEEIRQFRVDLNEKYPQNPLDFYEGSYNDAVNEARRSARFLVVYLHNPSHIRTNEFLNNYLLTERFQDFLQTHDCFIWGASVRSGEGYKVALALKEMSYPCLALLCLRENRMSCVLRLTGTFTEEGMYASLIMTIDENRRFLNAIVHERAQRELNNQLRREQEMEYERALAADRAKLTERRRIESERVEAERLEEEEKRQVQERKQRFIAKKETIRGQLMANETAQNGIDTNRLIRVSVRFPCGTKYDRDFDMDESLESLFNAVLVHEKCPEDFALLSSYPRRQLNCAPEWYREFGASVQDPAQIPTFRESGFEKSVVVLVRDNEA